MVTDSISGTEKTRVGFFSVRINFWRTVSLFLVALAAATLLGMLAGRWWWVFELASHFPVQYAFLVATTTLLCLVGRQWWLARVAAAVLVLNLGVILPFYWGRADSDTNQKTLRLISTNVLTSNRQYDRLIELVRTERADAAIFLEVDDAWLKHLAALADDYPVTISRTRSDNFGVAMFSRLPADRLEIVNLGPAGLPSVVAELRNGEQRFTVVATHPLPPTSAEYSLLRNQQLAAVAELAATVEGPVIVAGDLNITPWSPYFRDLLDHGNLRDSMRGFGIQPTWGWAGIPIDHALCSADVTIVDRRVGPPIGSDHLPLVFEFSLPADER